MQAKLAQLLQAAEPKENQGSTQAATTTDPVAGTDVSKAVSAGSTAQASTAAASTFFPGARLAESTGVISAASKTGKSQPAGASFDSNAAGVSVASDENSPKNSAVKVVDAESHGAQVSAQSAPHADAGASQTIAVAMGTGQNSPQQSFPSTAHAATGQMGQEHVSQGSSDATPTRSTAAAEMGSDEVNNGAASGMAAINTARVIQSMNESEMRVGMHSSEFGGIAIRTTVSQQQVQAQISVDHSELGDAISAHIPSVQTKLGNDLGLHASIEVNQSGSSLSGGQEQSSQRDSKSTVPSNSAVDVTAETAETFYPAIMPAETDAYRLDIRA
ncbi:MAG: hypothetical protein ACLQKY_09195 [Terracidiphilus sp.]